MGNCLPQISPMWVLLMGSRSQWVVPVWAPSMACSAPVWNPCQLTCSSMGSSVHGSTGPVRNLFQHGLLCPWLYRSWQEPALAWAACTQLYRSWQEGALAWAPLSMALQVLAGAYSSMGFPQAFLGILLLPAWGALWAAGDLCTSIDLHGMQGHILPHSFLHHGLQCSGTWSSSSLSFNDLVCRAHMYSMYSHSSLLLKSLWFCCSWGFFVLFPF